MPRRGQVHAGLRVREVGAAQPVEAEVDRALAGGVRARQEREPGVRGGDQAADDPQPGPRGRGQQRQVVAVGKRGVVVGDGEPYENASRAPGEQAGAARFPYRSEEFDVEEEQVAAAAVRFRVAGDGAQGAGGLFGGGRLPQRGERRLRPRRAPGGDGLDALAGAQAAVRRDRRPGNGQAGPAQLPVGERAVAQAHRPVGHAEGPARPSGRHVADREEPAVASGDPGADPAVSRVGDHGFGEQPVQAERAVRTVRAARPAADGGQLRPGRGSHAAGGAEEFGQGGDEVGGAVRRIAGAGRAQQGDDGQRGGRRPGQPAETGGVGGAQEGGLGDGPGPVDAGLQHGGARRPQGVGGGALGVTRRLLRGGGVGFCGARRLRGFWGRLFGGLRRLVGRGGGAGDGRAVHARRGEETTAGDVLHAGHHPARGMQAQLALVVDLDRHGVPVTVRRAGAELGDRRVQALAQPGREGLHERGGDLRRHGRQLVGVHAVFSPIQRASSSGLRAATGIPAATSCPAIPVE